MPDLSNDGGVRLYYPVQAGRKVQNADVLSRIEEYKHDVGQSAPAVGGVEDLGRGQRAGIGRRIGPDVNARIVGNIQLVSEQEAAAELRDRPDLGYDHGGYRDRARA